MLILPARSGAIFDLFKKKSGNFEILIVNGVNEHFTQKKTVPFVEEIPTSLMNRRKFLKIYYPVAASLNKPTQFRNA